MPSRTIIPRLTDILNAIVRIRRILDGIDIDKFEEDVDKRWLVERGIEIISEASRHLTDDLKARQTGIPWKKVANIGKVLRHAYDHVAPDLLWKLVQDDLPLLDAVCREELALATVHEAGRENPDRFEV